MGGVNLVEESRNILAANADLVSGQLRSCKDETFLDSQRLHARIADISSEYFIFFSQYPVSDDITLLDLWKFS
jgi:hypothetical protein